MPLVLREEEPRVVHYLDESPQAVQWRYSGAHGVWLR